MMLSELGARTEGQLIGDDQSFSAVSTDTRTLSPGDLFVAIRGDRFDGHTFVEKAVECGACAVVVESPQDHVYATQLVVNDSVVALGQAGALNRTAFSGKVLAITGSNGKTTVKGMLHSIMSEHCSTLATEANFNNHIGVPLTLMRLNDSYGAAVIEAGTSGKSEIAYLANLIQPEIALVNNVMAAHLLGFGSEEAIAKEKAEIYSAGEVKVGVVNLNCAYKDVFMARLSGKKIFGFAVETQAEKRIVLAPVFAEQGNAVVVALVQPLGENESLSFKLLWQGSEFPVQLNICGAHNIANAAAAAACALAADVQIESIVSGLEKFSGVPGRMQITPSVRCALLVDDTYNANPGSMRAAINHLSQYEKSLLIVGDMGEIGEGELAAHEKMGCYAHAKGIEQVIGVGELSRTLVKAYGKNGISFGTCAEAIEYLETTDISEFSVLVKGSRSAKMERIVQQLEQSGGGI